MQAETWQKQVAKSRSDEFKPTPGAQGTFVCSNQFPMGSSAKAKVSFPVPLQFEQLTRESDVRFYTGLTSTESFKCVFDYLLPEAMNMQYWHGPKQTEETPRVIKEHHSNSLLILVLEVVKHGNSHHNKNCF